MTKLTIKREGSIKFEIVVSILAFIISIVFIFVGFDKILNYDNSTWNPVNVYVEGDAYNYIINTGYANGYFILALLFAVIGCTFLIISTIRRNTEYSTNFDIESTQTQNETKILSSELPPL